MAGTLSDKVSELARLLDTLQADNVQVFDLRGKSSWTDYLLIATVRSLTHMRGLAVQLERRCQDLGLPLRRPPRVEEGQTWLSCDAGQVVCHLMDRQAREFYLLEDLYFDSPVHLWQQSDAGRLARDSHGR